MLCSQAHNYCPQCKLFGQHKQQLTVVSINSLTREAAYNWECIIIIMTLLGPFISRLSFLWRCIYKWQAMLVNFYCTFSICSIKRTAGGRPPRRRFVLCCRQIEKVWKCANKNLTCAVKLYASFHKRWSGVKGSTHVFKNSHAVYLSKERKQTIRLITWYGENSVLRINIENVQLNKWWKRKSNSRVLANIIKLFKHTQSNRILKQSAALCSLRNIASQRIAFKL